MTTKRTPAQPFAKPAVTGMARFSTGKPEPTEATQPRTADFDRTAKAGRDTVKRHGRLFDLLRDA